MPYCGPFEVPYIIDMRGNSATIILVIKFRFHSNPSRIRVPFFPRVTFNKETQSPKT